MVTSGTPDIHREADIAMSGEGLGRLGRDVCRDISSLCITERMRLCADITDMFTDVEATAPNRQRREDPHVPQRVVGPYLHQCLRHWSNHPFSD